MIWVYYILAFLGTVLIHELGHSLATLLCGAKIKICSLGFGKPFISKKTRGIEFRLTPWLVGGYVNIDDVSFSKQRYIKKIVISLLGCFFNLCLYLLLSMGEFSLFKEIFLLFNLIALLNLLPVPPLDGSKLWTVFLSKKVNKILNVIGSIVVVGLIILFLNLIK